MDGFLGLLVAKYNYWGCICLMMVGLYAMIVKKNLIKKIVGMNILQTAIVLFYISVATRRGGEIPIYQHTHGAVSAHPAVHYINPLPHVLMLTAIVVAVATFGVAVALAIRIYRQYGSLEEDDIQAMLTETRKEP